MKTNETSILLYEFDALKRKVGPSQGSNIDRHFDYLVFLIQEVQDKIDRLKTRGTSFLD